MSITVQHKNEILAILKEKYPGWTGFNNETFRRQASNYRRSAAKKATSLLSESTLAQLLVTRNTNSFLDRLHRLGDATSLLQSETDGPEHGDLEILHIRTLDKPVFCAQIYHLLHGSQSIYDRLDAYLHYVEDHELPNTWKFPTYFLQMCFPETEFFVDPRSTERLLHFLGNPVRLGKPSAETYRMLKDVAYDLKKAFADYAPADLIDIQSAVQVCFSVRESKVYSSVGQDTYEQSAVGHATTTTDSDSNFDYAMYSATEEELFWADDSVEDSDPTMLYISEVSDESSSESAKTTPSASDHHSDIPDVESLQRLYKSFINVFMSSPSGVAQAVEYARAREAAEQNFSHLIARHELGEKVTDHVFLHLLPHSETDENLTKGAWVHPIGSASEPLLTSLYRKYPSNSPIRQQIAEVLLEFIRHCIYKANALEKSSEALARLDSISIIDLPSITPILHALKPNQYILLHDTSIAAINRLMGTSFGPNLQELPELNAAGIQLIQALREDISTNRLASVQDSDLFDIFSHWLVKNGDKPIERDTETHIAAEPEKEQHPVPEPPAPPPVAPPPLSTEQTSALSDSLEACGDYTGIQLETLSMWRSVLGRKKMLIFYGPSGTGKTFTAQHFASALAGNSDGVIQLLQFHPAITFETFWGKPDGLKPGIFQQFCQDAAKRTGPCIFIIDEINRADTAEILGDLLFKMEYPPSLSVPYATTESGTLAPVRIPSNVYIIGTMRPDPTSSIHTDTVLKRRFAFVPMWPDYEILKRFHATTTFQVEGLVRTLAQINSAIEAAHLQIGISYFLREDLSDHIESIWTYEVEPALEVALRHDQDKLESFRWMKIRRRLTR